mmetsp:Transcript_13420/g.33850  ORF Transcript_13420/g.33850 Transcript_13420/m.33850 type:complete len:206 (-) Transcript_13420:478-1095(-)
MRSSWVYLSSSYQLDTLERDWSSLPRSSCEKFRASVMTKWISLAMSSSCTGVSISPMAARTVTMSEGLMSRRPRNCFTRSGTVTSSMSLWMKALLLAMASRMYAHCFEVSFQCCIFFLTAISSRRCSCSWSSGKSSWRRWVSAMRAKPSRDHLSWSLRKVSTWLRQSLHMRRISRVLSASLPSPPMANMMLASRLERRCSDWPRL